jgi:hypothetical protein
MESVDQIRKARLAMLVAEFGGVTSIASAIKRSPSQVSQWLNSSPDSRTQKPRTISNASARYIEQQCLLSLLREPIPASRFTRTEENQSDPDQKPIHRKRIEGG